MKTAVFSLTESNSKNYESLLWCFIFLFLISLRSFPQAQIVNDFTSSGSYTVPPEFAYIRVETWGGGGGGGGANSLVSLVGAAFGGGGGGAGAYNSRTFNVSPSQSYTFNFTIGAGGAGAAVNGANGGTTSATWTTGGGGTLTANGGSGGSQGFLVVGVGGLSVTITQGVGGAGGTASPGGIAGGAGVTATGAGSGKGGDSPNGGVGGNSVTTTNVGANGASRGGGGSGGCINEPITLLLNRAGGNGGNGHVRITAYRCNPETASISTWNGTSWANGVPTTSKKAIINGNYNTAINGNITACSCEVNSGRTLTIAASNHLEVYNEIINHGTIEVTNNGSLVQWYTAISNTNDGTVRIYRNAKPMRRYDFTYWSSPVTGQTLYNLSPITLFDKYFSWTPASGWTSHAYGAATMQVAKGYIVRAPQSFPVNTTDNFTGVFTGAPNNGEKIVPGFQGSTTAEVWNLIGNPYPSAININLFLTDPDNSEVGGTVYLWTHNTPPEDGGEGTYTYTSNDYATYNLSGGVATALPSVGATDPEDNTSVLTNGHIASGQAFFIRGIKNYEDSEPGNVPIKVKFKNSMRILSNNSNFFRPGPASPVENWETTGKHRFWIDFRNNEGAFHQTLVGYIESATDGEDRLYDGELFGGNFVTVYSLLNGKNFAIQGKGLPFNDEDVVPLGYKVTIAGNFFINLSMWDGLFEGQDIFLRDKDLNIIHNLKQGAYNFTSAIGTFDERFEIVYKNQTLGVENPESNSDNIIVYKNSSSEIVVNAGRAIINEIRVFDIAGRLLYQEQEVNNQETVLQNLPITQQVLIVDVLTVEGIRISKKIVR